ncbi:MAG: endonuclease [Glaciihabitans sp.]|nr:endonuclease [Glaciihabitans sp.]
MSAHSSRGTAWHRLRLAVLERDGWVCTYCNKALEGDDATADHITPRVAGGRDETTNLVAACRSCNAAKQDKVMARVNWVNTIWLDAA